MKKFRFVATAALLAAVLLPAAAAEVSATTSVTPGHSIQAAINAAPSGGTVVVERGTYRENLLITKAVRIISHGAVLRPPTTPVANPCSENGETAGTVTGVCVTGQVGAQGAVTATVNNVWISGLTVIGFSGEGLFAYGSNGLHLIGNRFADNGGYGAFVNTSSNSTILNNTSYRNGDAGFYIGDSPTANATLVGNSSWGNRGEGILWRDALGGRATLNDLHGNCIGMLVVDSGAPGAAGNVSIALNNVQANNLLCPADTDHPPFGGIGIGLIGAQNTTVLVNLIRGNVGQTGSAFPGGGVILIDATMLGGAAPSNDNVHHNWLSGNAPNDILSDGSGTGNNTTGNNCTTSTPTGSC